MQVRNWNEEDKKIRDWNVTGIIYVDTENNKMKTGKNNEGSAKIFMWREENRKPVGNCY